MALLDHVSDVAFASSIPTDLILGTYSGTLTAPAPGTGFPTKTVTTSTLTTDISEKTFFQGVFSTDNGLTWVDFNSNITNHTNPAQVGLQTQMMYAYMKPGRIILAADNWNYYNGIGFTSAAYTFIYKIVLFARPNQGNVIPQPVGQQQNFSSAYNYQKIFRDSVFNMSIPTTTTTLVLNHNLGYIPKIRSYIDNFSYADDPAAMYDMGYYFSQFTIFQCYMDTTTVKYYFDNTAGAGPMTGTLYTRIYYDA